MPAYLRRTPAEFPTEFCRSPANPEGFEFYCCFCLNHYRTRRGLIQHMRRCDDNPDVDQDLEELYIDDNETVGDFLNNHEIISNTVKIYIRTNELESFSDRSGTEIQNIIEAKLRDNGYADHTDLYRVKFLIYQFFFETTDTEKTEFNTLCSDRILASWDNENHRFF